MRLEIGRVLVTALVGLILVAASGCGEPAPEAVASPPPSAAAPNPTAVCDALTKARQAALDALAPVAKSLAQDKPSAGDIAKATDDLKAAFTVMHLDVAAAAAQARDPQLKAKIDDYQFAIEQAIVVVEGADGDKTQLAAAIDLPELRSAEQAVLASCT